ncbi:MAG TPA: DMT family transporter [Stellaceae bacterium]|nr:DMT family transporter [Stellaceae bacterium]
MATASLLWAGNWIVGRAVRDTIPPVALTFWRWSIAALLLAPLALPRLRGKGAVLRHHWRVLFLLGLTGVALFQGLIYTGLRFTTSVNGVLMNSAAPLFILLVAWLLDRERVTPRQMAGMALSFLGILVIMNGGDIATLAHFRFNPGDLIILLAMPTWGLYSVLVRRRPNELDPPSLIFVIALIGVMVLAPAYAAESFFLAAPHLTLSAVAAVLYVACFASIGAYLCWNRGVELVGPNNAGFTIHLLPAFGSVLAVVALHEEVHVFHAVGIATILFGVWLATSARRR